MCVIHKQNTLTGGYIVTYNCYNDFSRVENVGGTVFCPETCGVCGGTGCGSILGTKVDDCCASNIIVSGVYYTEGKEAPCTLVNNTNTATPTVNALPFS